MKSPSNSRSEKRLSVLFQMWYIHRIDLSWEKNMTLYVGGKKLTLASGVVRISRENAIVISTIHPDGLAQVIYRSGSGNTKVA